MDSTDEFPDCRARSSILPDKFVLIRVISGHLIRKLS